MNWGEVFSIENIQTIATICGTIAFTAYMSYKTFKSRLDEAIKNGKTDVSKKVRRQTDLDCEIIKEAEKIKELLDADRVQVYEFHNGAHYANGRSALKTTCTYEVCRYGTSNCINLLSGIPLSCIPSFIKLLLDKGEMYVKNMEDVKEDMPSTYSLKNSMNVTSFYDVVIYNDNREPVGFVAVQFCDGKNHNVNKDIVKKFAWFVESKLADM